MARIETRDDDPQIPAAPVGPPRGDEGLDDWFTRRLEAQGIAARGRGFPTARVLSVIALIVAVVALFWVIRDATGSSSDTGSKPTSTATQPQNSTGGNPPDSTGDTGGAAKPIPWQEVKVTIVNGNGITGAAGDAQNTLTQAGWKIVDTTDTDAGVTVDSTEVVYPPGKKAPAKAVASQLGLGAPVALADATGVPADLTTVAVVLGPEGLPSTT